jgi:integrase
VGIRREGERTVPATWIETYKGKKGTTYTVRWRDEIGVKQRSPQTFKSKAEALAFQSLVEGGRLPKQQDTMSFAQAWDRFIEGATLRQDTRDNYWGYAKNQLLPYFAAMEVAAVRKATLRDWITWVWSTTDSVWTIRESFVVLRSCFSYCVLPLELRDDNPCDGMAKFLPPKPAPMERGTLDPARVRLLSDVVFPEYRMVILTCGILGLRGCEVFPLERQDLDFKTGLITVSKSVVPTKKGMIVGPPKNGKVQTVPMGFLQPEFEKHLRSMDNIAPGALLFPSARTGGYIHRDTIRKHVKKVGLDIGLDETMCAKVLRSSAATNANIYGDIEWAAELLRHADPKVTLQHYVKQREDRQQESWDRLRDAFGD